MRRSRPSSYNHQSSILNHQPSNTLNENLLLRLENIGYVEKSGVKDINKIIVFLCKNDAEKIDPMEICPICQDFMKQRKL
jgi:hypothetical protein